MLKHQPSDVDILEGEHSCYKDDDKPHEECGVFGIYTPNSNAAARLTFFALFALQHRGQEGCGIASADGSNTFYTHRGLGLVTQVFKEEQMQQLKGHFAVGHTRYSTVGGNTLRNAQPFVIETSHGPLAVVHNGQLTQANTLRKHLMKKGVGMFTSSDTEVITQMLAMPPADEHEEKPDWEGRIRNFMELSSGAYSLMIMTKDAIFGVRDPHGFRPLCLGKIPVEEGSDSSLSSYCVASESCALGTIGAELIREVQPGEIIRIDSSGLHSSIGVPSKGTSLCAFEYVYFARPDSILENDHLVHSIRQELGKQLAIEQPCPGADIVIGVPDSSTPAAIGYSTQSGIPFSEGLTKNRYIARTFIQPDQEMRTKTIKLKFNPLSNNLRGKNVVVIDDSIVRGNTLKYLIALLKTAEPKSLHVRISSPPIKHPCFMGVDMPTYEELIAHIETEGEILKRIGADSLGYLSVEGMLKVIGAHKEQQKETENKKGQTGGCGKGGYCSACFSGEYPVDIEDFASQKPLYEQKQEREEKEREAVISINEDETKKEKQQTMD